MRGEAIFFEVDPAQLPAGEFPRAGAPALRGEGRWQPQEVRLPGDLPGAVQDSGGGAGQALPGDPRRPYLALDRAPYTDEPDRRAHLYQEFCPIDPMVASLLERWRSAVPSPIRRGRCTCRALCSPSCHCWAGPRPVNGLAHDLPYPNMAHLRDAGGFAERGR